MNTHVNFYYYYKVGKQVVASTKEAIDLQRNDNGECIFLQLPTDAITVTL